MNKMKKWKERLMKLLLESSSERVDVVLTGSGEIIKCHQKQYAQHGRTTVVNTSTTLVIDFDSGTEGTDLEVKLSEVSSGGDKKWQEIDKISLTEDNEDILKSNDGSMTKSLMPLRSY